MTIKLLLGPPGRPGLARVVSVVIVTVITLDVAPLLGNLVAPPVQGEAVLPVGHEAAELALQDLQ